MLDVVLSIRRKQKHLHLSKENSHSHININIEWEISVSRKTKIQLKPSPNTLDEKSNLSFLIYEIDPTSVPPRYIDYLEIVYKDGSTICVSSEHITQPIQINSTNQWPGDAKQQFSKVKEIIVYIDTKILEYDISEYLTYLFFNRLG